MCPLKSLRGTASFGLQSIPTCDQEMQEPVGPASQRRAWSSLQQQGKRFKWRSSPRGSRSALARGRGTWAMR